MRATALALLAGACSPTADAPASRGTPATSARVAPLAATGSSLRGQVSALQGDASALQTRVTDLGTVVELPTDTLFAFDKAELSREAEGNLAKVAELIRQAPPGTIAITGHTDGKGGSAYNKRLSERRAAAVADWMRAQAGLRQRTFTAAGVGERMPLVPDTRDDGADDPAARARNRRVEILLPKAG